MSAALLIFAAVLLSACSPRGPIRSVPPETPAGETVDVFVATNRSDFLRWPKRGRSYETRRFLYTIRVPTDHAPGELPLPGRRVDASRHFLAQSALEFRSEVGFAQAISARLARLPKEEREVFVYVHGFNTTFEQGVVRLAQLHHDLELPGVAVHFSWPSAGTPLDYAYDRDSALFSRDALESLLRALPDTKERPVVFAHSMGAQILMEALRQIEIATPGWVARKLGGVVLVSPDIDPDVFRQQVGRFRTLPEPFVIFVSKHDRALSLAARISGERNRLGNLASLDALADLDVVVINVSDFSEGIGHFTFASSPALIRILRQLARVDTSLRDEGGRTGLVPGTVLTVRNVTEVILSPLSALDAK